MERADHQRKKTGAGTRLVVSFSRPDKARQRLLSAGLTPFASLHPSQFLLAQRPEGRGRTAACNALLRQLGDVTDDHVFMQIDIRDFYGSISHQWLEDQARPPAGTKPAEALDRRGPALALDASDPDHRATINDILQRAWSAISPLLEGPGSTYALDLRKATLAPVRSGWICPITNRVLPRLVFGVSPYSIKTPGDAAKPEPIQLPTLSQVFPRSARDRASMEKRLEADPMVSDLRDKGLWSNLHVRAAMLTPYYRAEEHSAQQPPHRLRGFEAQFRDYKINLLACSTTMEMGVDIGSVEAVLNTNVPPSIANYRQRVGRAGRRGQGFSSSLTFARDTPLDREAFRQPADYLKRALRAPRVKLDSEPTRPIRSSCGMSPREAPVTLPSSLMTS